MCNNSHLYVCTKWFKYDRDKLWLVYTQIVPVIFEQPCMCVALRTSSVEQSPSREAQWVSDSSFLRDRNILCRIHRDPRLDPIHIHVTQFHVLTNHFNNIFPCTLGLLWQDKGIFPTYRPKEWGHQQKGMLKDTTYLNSLNFMKWKFLCNSFANSARGYEMQSVACFKHFFTDLRVVQNFRTGVFRDIPQVNFWADWFTLQW
jgi:hypothetical protein